MQKVLIPTLAVIVLAGCQSGGGGVAVPVPPPAAPTPPVGPVSGTVYRTLDSTDIATGDLASIGTATTGAQVGLRLGAGQISHANDGILVQIAGSNFADPNGPTTTAGNTRVYTDGTTTVETARLAGYEYVEAYVQQSTGATPSTLSTGYIGVSTNPDDMPTGGVASYNGTALVAIRQGAAAETYRDLTSTVNADFQAGRVDAIVDGFAANAPIDRMTVGGMTITGSSFAGGAIATTNNGAAVDLAGSNRTQGALGQFFGLNGTTNNPEEVAGMAVQQGDTGSVILNYQAD